MGLLFLSSVCSSVNIWTAGTFNIFIFKFLFIFIYYYCVCATCMSGAGSSAWVLCRSRKCSSLLSRLSSPTTTLLLYYLLKKGASKAEEWFSSLSLPPLFCLTNFSNLLFDQNNPRKWQTQRRIIVPGSQWVKLCLAPRCSPWQKGLGAHRQWSPFLYPL